VTVSDSQGPLVSFRGPGGFTGVAYILRGDVRATADGFATLLHHEDGYIRVEYQVVPATN
jgi:hypothetical protein